jgi:hypothetical protein
MFVRCCRLHKAECARDDAPGDQLRLCNIVLGQRVWPSAAKAQDACVGSVLKSEQGHHEKQYKKLVRDTTRSGDAGSGSMSPPQALDEWKDRAGWQGNAMLQQCIELYHHGIFLPIKLQSTMCVSEVEIGGFDTPVSQSGVGMMLLTHYCELTDAVRLRLPIGLGFIKLCLNVYLTIQEGAEAYECGRHFVDPGIPPPVDAGELYPGVILSTPPSADKCCVMQNHSFDRDLGAESYLTPDLSSPTQGMHPTFAQVHQAGGMELAWPAQELAAPSSSAACAVDGPGQAYTLEFQQSEESVRSLRVVYTTLLYLERAVTRICDGLHACLSCPICDVHSVQVSSPGAGVPGIACNNQVHVLCEPALLQGTCCALPPPHRTPPAHETCQQRLELLTQMMSGWPLRPSYKLMKCTLHNPRWTTLW